MRIYTDQKTGQYLADLRADGGGRDIRLGTADEREAYLRAGIRLGELRAARAPRGAEQVQLLSAGGAYRLAECLRDLVDYGVHRCEDTRDTHERYARYLVRDLGDLPIEATCWWDVLVTQRARWKARELSNDTIRKWESTLRRAVRTAHARGKIRVPPAWPESMPSQTVPRDRWFDVQEILAFVAAIMTRPAPNQPHPLRYARAVRFMLRCWLGMGNTEARTLQVRSVSLVHGTWERPQRRKTSVAGGEFEMPPPMLVVVRGWLDSPQGRRLRRDDPILPSWSNEWRGLNAIADHLRVPPVCPHDYRRTCAHLLRMCGLDKSAVKRWLALAANSAMLDRVYLQDDPLSRFDPERVAQLTQAFGLGPHERAYPRDSAAAPVARGVKMLETSPAYGTTSVQPPPGMDFVQVRYARSAEGRIVEIGRSEVSEVQGNKGEIVGGGEGKLSGGRVEVVPRDGIEPPTQGFSVPMRDAEIISDSGCSVGATSFEPPSPDASAVGASVQKERHGKGKRSK